MIEIKETIEFSDFISNLSDEVARAKIVARIRRFSGGNPGDVAPVGSGVSEMRIHHGPGYRIYFVQRGRTVVVLLCGGDKSTQRKDIALAKLLAKDLEN